MLRTARVGAWQFHAMPSGGVYNYAYVAWRETSFQFVKNGSISLVILVNVSTGLATEYRLLSKIYSKPDKKYRSLKYLCCH